MKRTMLLAFATMLCCLGSWAQDGKTFATAFNLADHLQGNTLSYTCATSEDAQNGVYFKIEVPAEKAQTISVADGTAYTSLRNADESYNYDYTSATDKDLNLNFSITPLEAGKTYYLKLYSWSSTQLTATVILKDEFKGGASCDEATTVPSNELTLVSAEVDVPTYMAYYVESDGVLVVDVNNGSNSTLSASCDDQNPVMLQSGRNKVQVEGGKTYILKTTQSYSWYQIVVKMNLTHPVAGSSCDMAIAVQKGADETFATATLAKEAGTYWYVYEATMDGYITLASESDLTGGTVKFYDECSEYSSARVSVKDGFYVRYAIRQGMMYYIEVTRATEVAEPTTFTLTENAAGPGDTRDNPIVITDNKGHVSGYYNNTYYFKVTTPASDGRWFINVNSDVVFEKSGTGIAIENKDGRQLAFNESYTANVRIDVGGNEEIYIQCRMSENYCPFDFTISYEAVEEGDVCGMAIAATTGQNTIPTEKTEKWYAYTATMNGWLSIEPDDSNVSVSFPYSCENKNMFNAVTKDGFASKIKVLEGNTYVIWFKNLGTTRTFTLSETEFVEGEDCSKPIVITGTENPLSVEFPETIGEWWYQFTPAEDGKMTLSCDMEAERDADYNINDLKYKLGDCMQTEYSTSSWDNTAGKTVMKSTFVVTGGQPVFIHVKRAVASTQKGTMTIATRELQPGESCSLPIEVESNTIMVANGFNSRAEAVWFKVELVPGDFYIDGLGFGMYLYKDCNSTNYLAMAQYQGYDYDKYGYIYKLSYTVTEAGSYYLQWYQSDYADNVVTLSGSAFTDPTAIKNESYADGNLVRGLSGSILVDTKEATQVNIYDISGKLVEATQVDGTAMFRMRPGLYLVRVGDNVTKVVVNN